MPHDYIPKPYTQGGAKKRRKCPTCEAAPYRQCGRWVGDRDFRRWETLKNLHKER